MTDIQEKWKKLLNPDRRKDNDTGKTYKREDTETRTEIERDYDRILFSTPVRRLADKTQVFPLDKNDSVRTRLTHSHEVSNLARSIGTALVFKDGIASSSQNYQRDVPACLAAIGLAHDLGNPPFGHQGEAAIQSWFKDNEAVVLKPLTASQQQMNDFLKFEGNAQGFRLVTKLQLLNNNYGLDLTYATLAALMKYPTSSDQLDEGIAAKKKHGFFFSEQAIAENVLDSVALGFGKRHPLAYLMEACDDIAYVVLDVEDAIKKGLASYADLIAYLEHHGKSNDIIKKVIKESQEKHIEYRDNYILSPSELDDISMQRFRVAAIKELIVTARLTFIKHQSEFVTGIAIEGVLAKSEGELLRKLLKAFAFTNAYQHKDVLKVELQGYNTIRGLMDIFWAAIIDRKDNQDVTSKRNSPFAKFVYGRISENYRRVYESKSNTLPIRYKDCQLLTDMIAGMTDSYAVDLFKELDSMRGSYDVKQMLTDKINETSDKTSK